MKRLLLTGATGFIGKHCLQSQAMEKVFEVHGVSSKKQKMDIPGVYWHQADLLDPRQVSGLLARVRPSHLLHLAWYTMPGLYWNSVENIRWVQASLDLLQAFSRYGGRRIVVAGTCAEYDWRYGYLSENVTPILPETLYGICKNAFEKILNSFAEQTKLSTAWGRIFFLYGPSDHRTKLVSSVTLALLQGRPARCSHGNQIRDYLYVQDVAEAFLALLKSDVQGPVNIASGYPVSLKEIVYKIAEKLDRKDLVRLGALPAPPDEPDLLVGNVNRLSNEVGWRPKYDLSHGLDETIDWWRHLKNNDQLE